jgi:hypothetical protein
MFAMRCDEARWYLELRRGEGNEALGPEVQAALEEHLRDCARCAAFAHTEERWDRQLSEQLRQVPVPAQLADALLTQAAVYRGQALRFRFYRYSAVAASLLLLASLGWLGYRASRPTFSTEQLVLLQDIRIQDPASYFHRWLEQEGLPSELPEPFDLNLLEQVGYEVIQGQKVPVALFRHPQRAEFARVYFLRQYGPFRLHRLSDADASHTVARVIAEPRRFRGVTYVIVYPAGPEGLNPFLRPNPATS